MLVVIAALQRELNGLLKLLVDKSTHQVGDGTVTQGLLDDRPIGLVQSGIGKELSQTATRHIILQLNPEVILSIGLSGGVNHDVHGGDLVIGTSLIGMEEGEDIATAKSIRPTIEPDRYLIQASKEALDGKDFPIHSGEVISVPRMMPGHADKIQFSTRISVKVIDMESYWVAAIAQAANIPCLALRAVSDEVSDSLPSYESFMDPMGKIKPLAALTYFSTRPWYFFDLPRFAMNAQTGQRRLTSFVQHFASKIYRSGSASK